MMDLMLNALQILRIARVDFSMTDLELIVWIMWMNVSKIYTSAMGLAQSASREFQIAHRVGSMTDQALSVSITPDNVNNNTLMTEQEPNVSQILKSVRLDTLEIKPDQAALR